MAGYTKLFSTIVTSSIWSEDDKTRIMWITMLATADAGGHVDGAIPGMAAIARMTVDEAAAAIRKLESPDTFSRTPDHDGRRIEPEPGGWRILNYTAYRERRDPEKRREQNREAKRRQRNRGGQPCQPRVSQNQPKSAQAEAYASVPEEKETETTNGNTNAKPTEFEAALIARRTRGADRSRQQQRGSDGPGEHGN